MKMNLKTIVMTTVALAAMTAPALAQNSAALCKIYAVQGGAAAVPATYQPGVDVNGNPVVSADGGAAPVVGAPGSVRIPVTVELAQQLGAVVPAGVALDAPVGVVNIAGNGTVSFNGQDITAQTAALCAQPYVPTEAIAQRGDTAVKATPASSNVVNGFDYDAAWSPARAAAAGIIPTADGMVAPAAPAPMGIVPASAPLAADTVVPAEPPVPAAPSMADEPQYTPPAVVPAVSDMNDETKPVDVMGNAAAGGAVHTPAPAEAMTEQDGIMYGEGQ